MKVFVGDPTNINQYRNKIHEVTTLQINFGSPKFKNVTDHSGYIKKWIDEGATSIEALKISASDRLIQFPKEITLCPIKDLELRNCNNFVVGTNLKLTPLLETFTIEYSSKLEMGIGFPISNNLKSIRITCEKINNFNSISNCKSLVKLNLQNLTSEFLPEEISNLGNLKELFIWNLPKLKTLPSLKNCKNLNLIYLANFPNLESNPIDFSQFSFLESLGLHNFGNKNSNLEFPQNLDKCTSLIKLHLSGFPFRRSEHMNPSSELESSNLDKVVSFPDVFHNLENLKKLNIHSYKNLESLPTSLDKLKNIEEFSLIDLPKLKAIDFSFSNFQKLKSIQFKNLGLKKIPDSLGKCVALTTLNLEGLNTLNELPKEIFEAKALAIIKFADLAFTTIPEAISTLPALDQLTVTDCKNLQSLPAQLSKSPTLRYLNLEKNNPSIFHSNSYSVFKDAFWDKDIEARTHFVNWSIKKEKEIPMPLTIGSSILKLMSNSGIEKVSVPYDFKLSDLNFGEKAIDSNAITNGGKVFISGRLIGGKDDAKKKLEGLGLKVVNKLTDDVAFVLLGSKPKYAEGLYNEKRIYFTQKELENLKKEVNPGMLQTEDSPTHFIENLNELLLSTDPANIKIALELVHHHGLPYELEESFLVLSHTLSPGKLKNEIRRFLRGKISKEKEVILESKTYPFAPHKVNNLKDEEAARLYHMYYKKTGKISPWFFQHCDASFPDRREMFEKILPTLTKNPKRINIEAVFTTDELNELLSLPKFQGTLSDITFFHPKSSAKLEGLFLHKAYLKKLTVSLHRTKGDFPQSIFELENLTELRLGLQNHSAIPMGLSNLKKLKKLTFTGLGITLELPENLIHLTKLKQLNIYTTNSNIDSFKGKMPWVNV